MKMNRHYDELKASYLFVEINHKIAAFQETHPDQEIIRLGIGDVTQPWPSAWWRPCTLLWTRWAPRRASTATAPSRATAF